MTKHAIIVAGGSGVRMGAPVPKQFLTLAGRPVLMQTMQRFVNAISQIKMHVVLPEQEFDKWQQLILEHNFDIPHTVIPGGKERFYSVKNAIDAIKDNEGMVAVHDGVRPLVSEKLIRLMFAAAEQHKAAIPVITLAESLRKLTTKDSVAENRNEFRLVQTPQVFDLGILKHAYHKPYLPAYTDDASVVELSGQPIYLVEGERLNLKITTPGDMVIAEALWNKHLEE